MMVLSISIVLLGKRVTACVKVGHIVTLVILFVKFNPQLSTNMLQPAEIFWISAVDVSWESCCVVDRLFSTLLGFWVFLDLFLVLAHCNLLSNGKLRSVLFWRFHLVAKLRKVS